MDSDTHNSDINKEDDDIFSKKKADDTNGDQPENPHHIKNNTDSRDNLQPTANQNDTNKETRPENDRNKFKHNAPNHHFPNKNIKDKREQSSYNKFHNTNKFHNPNQLPAEEKERKYVPPCMMKDYCASKAKYGSNIPAEASPIVEVVFKCRRKKLYRNDNGIMLREGDTVVVEVESGVDCAVVISCGSYAQDKHRTQYKLETPELNIIRKATQEDQERTKRNQEDELRAVEKTKEFIVNYKLDMKVTEADWQFDRQRLTIYFTAPQRIDFRDLVKDLARTFKTRIELRQISTREEAKRIGGMGPCGRNLCCSSFVHDFCHVTLDHARTQQLSNNVAKLSGYCGRLKCCLLYEYDNYIEAFKKYPPLNSIVQLPEGSARILKVDIFKDIIYLVVEKSTIYKNISFEELEKLNKEGKVLAPAKDDHNFAHQDVYFEDAVDLQVLQEEIVY